MFQQFGEEDCAVPPAAIAATWTVLFYLSALTLTPRVCVCSFLPRGMPYSVLDPSCLQTGGEDRMLTCALEP